MRENITLEAWDACTKAAEMSFYTCQSFTKHVANEIARCHELLENSDDPGERAYAVELIRDWGPQLAKFKDRQEFLDKRLEHALKCLKRKGLYAESVEKLMALCEDKGRMDDRGILQMIHCTMDHRILSVGRQDELDANCWRIGIDLSLVELEPDLAVSASLYGPVLERHSGRIFANTFMAACASKVSQLMDSENYRDAIKQPLLDKYFDSEQFKAMLEEKLAKPIAQMIEADMPEDGYAKHLEKKLDGAIREIKALEAEKQAAVSKAVAPVQARAEKLQTENADLGNEIRKLKTENGALMDALADRDRKLSGYIDSVDMDDLPELPEDGVIFAGGHPNMTKKLRQDHPGWTFIDGGDVNFPEFRGPAIIFFWDKHMCHPMWHRVRKFAPPGAPQAYLKSTNLDMLEAEMRRAWSAMCPVDGEEDRKEE